MADPQNPQDSQDLPQGIYPDAWVSSKKAQNGNYIYEGDVREGALLWDPITKGVGIITDISPKGEVSSVNLGSPNAKDYQGLRNAYLRQTGRNIAPLPQLAIPASEPTNNPIPIAGSEDDPLRVWRLQRAAMPPVDPLLETPLAAHARFYAQQQLDDLNKQHLSPGASALPPLPRLPPPSGNPTWLGSGAFLGLTTNADTTFGQSTAATGSHLKIPFANGNQVGSVGGGTSQGQPDEAPLTDPSEGIFQGRPWQPAYLPDQMGEAANRSLADDLEKAAKAAHDIRMRDGGGSAEDTGILSTDDDMRAIRAMDRDNPEYARFDGGYRPPTEGEAVFDNATRSFLPTLAGYAAAPYGFAIGDPLVPLSQVPLPQTQSVTFRTRR